MTAGDKVSVRLTRERIDGAAELWAVSSDVASLKVGGAANLKLPTKKQVDLELEGVTGGNPKVATVEIRYGSATGSAIHKLTVWVFTKLTVKLTPHTVTIADATHAGLASAANVNDIIGKVKAIWKPCGIDFNVQATQNDSHTFAKAGVAKTRNNVAGVPTWSAEASAVLSTYYVANTINAYFIRQLATDDSPGVLGHGISRTTSNASGGALPQPGIMLGDRNSTGTSRAADAMWLANDLAHEIGHFFGLWHPGGAGSTATRQDTWCRRMLMHNFNSMPKLGGFKDTVVGYGTDKSGNPRRGCLVTMKDLTQITTDAECTTARATISSAAGPY